MKSFIVCALLLAGTSAFAGYGKCDQTHDLACVATYNLASQKTVAGPFGDGLVTDLQPEPFDPANCEAAVVLYTVAGKVVANYNQNSGTISAWVDSEGQETSIFKDYRLDEITNVSAVIPVSAKGNVQSVQIQCSLTRDVRD